MAAPLALLLLIGTVPAGAADVVVDVSFSDEINDNMQAINSVERGGKSSFVEITEKFVTAVFPRSVGLDTSMLNLPVNDLSLISMSSLLKTSSAALFSGISQ